MHDLRREGIRGRRLPFLVVSIIIAFAGWIYVAGDPANQRLPIASPALRGYGTLPLSFEENRGQTDARVKFVARGNGYALFLTATEAVLKLRDRLPSRHDHNNDEMQFLALRIRLKDANETPDIKGINALVGRSNYFIGRDSKKWHTGIPTFAGARFANIYPGINLVYRGDQGRLEYDLEVRPGADPALIKLQIDGARRLAIDRARDLVISTPGGNVIQRRPVIYQTVAGQKRAVRGGYVLEDAQTVAFEVGGYDHSLPLVIDPLLTYASYLGGTGGDLGVSIAVDQTDGSAWVTGTTTSTDFPVTSDGFQQTNFGNSDIFMSKVSPDGSTLLYSTYAGGHSFEQATGIAVDPAGDAFATGLTQSLDFPVTIDAFQQNLQGTQDAFVVALDHNGVLIYSTHLGTNSAATQIAVGSTAEAVVVGTTQVGELSDHGGHLSKHLSGQHPISAGRVRDEAERAGHRAGLFDLHRDKRRRLAQWGRTRLIEQRLHQRRYLYRCELQYPGMRARLVRLRGRTEQQRFDAGIFR